MAYSDDVGAGAVALVPMNLTDSKLSLLTNIIENITKEKANNVDLRDTTKVKLDDLDARLNTILAADSVTDAEIQATLEAITDLQSDSTTSDTFIGVLGTIFNVLNTSNRIHTSEVLVNAASGIQAVDVSAHGFAADTDYQVQITLKGMSPVTVGYLNKTKDSFDLVVADSEEWEFNTDDIRYKDCSVSGEEVTVTIAIIALPVTKLTATFEEASGETITIGA